MARASSARAAEKERKVNARFARSRAFWSGTLTFGLVSIPVYLFPASRGNRSSLRMLGPKGEPLRREYYDPSTGEAVSGSEVQRGYELDDGRYVIVEDEELEALEPEKTRDIELAKFVDAAEIDPIYFERAYFLAPASNNARPYRLLAGVMEKTERAGLATFVMRGKEYLVAILAEGGILRGETLRFADEVRTPETVGLPEKTSPGEVLVRRYAKAVKKLAASSFDPAELEDREEARLRDLVAKKLKAGDSVVTVEDEAEDEAGGDEIPDLMNVLRWSLRKNREEGDREGEDLSALTKDQLYEKAQERDVSGRSSMSKKELIAALEAAE